MPGAKLFFSSIPKRFRCLTFHSVSDRLGPVLLLRLLRTTDERLFYWVSGAQRVSVIYLWGITMSLKFEHHSGIHQCSPFKMYQKAHLQKIVHILRTHFRFRSARLTVDYWLLSSQFFYEWNSQLRVRFATVHFSVLLLSVLNHCSFFFLRVLKCIVTPLQTGRFLNDIKVWSWLQLVAAFFMKTVSNSGGVWSCLLVFRNCIINFMNAICTVSVSQSNNHAKARYEFTRFDCGVCTV